MMRFRVRYSVSDSGQSCQVQNRWMLWIGLGSGVAEVEPLIRHEEDEGTEEESNGDNAQPSDQVVSSLRLGWG